MTEREEGAKIREEESEVEKEEKESNQGNHVINCNYP